MPLNRRKEREIVFQMLFASQFAKDADTDALYEDLISECESDGAKESEYIRTAFCGARDYANEALALIEENAIGWKVERLSKATLTILQLALFEMNRLEEIPLKIAINEAVELAKIYDDDNAPKFINGVLGGVAGK